MEITLGPHEALPCFSIPTASSSLMASYIPTTVDRLPAPEQARKMLAVSTNTKHPNNI